MTEVRRAAAGIDRTDEVRAAEIGTDPGASPPSLRSRLDALITEAAAKVLKAKDRHSVAIVAAERAQRQSSGFAEKLRRVTAGLEARREHLSPFLADVRREHEVALAKAKRELHDAADEERGAERAIDLLHLAEKQLGLMEKN